MSLVIVCKQISMFKLVINGSKYLYKKSGLVEISSAKQIFINKT